MNKYIYTAIASILLCNTTICASDSDVSGFDAQEEQLKPQDKRAIKALKKEERDALKARKQEKQKDQNRKKERGKRRGFAEGAE